MPDKCLFCPRAANSKEHLFPEWLNDEFPNPDNERRLVTKRIGDDVTEWYAWQTAYLEIRAVCKKCNETWMSGIESRTKKIILPMIRGNHVRLSPADQLELATWATLKTLVYDSHAGYESIADENDLAVMKTQERPPAHYRAYVAGQENAGLFSLHRVFVAGYQKGSDDLHRAAATTFVLGHLVVQTLGNPDTTFRAYTEVGIRKPQVQSIVPPIQAGASWPLPYLDDADLLKFGEANIAGNIKPEHRLDPATYPGYEAEPPPPESESPSGDLNM